MKILISDKISDKGIDILKKDYEVTIKQGMDEEELSDFISDFDAIIVRSKTKITKKIIDSAKNLKIIGRAGTGVDNIDIGYASEKGIKVMNTPTANSVSVAEHTIGLMLSLLRHVSSADKSMKQDLWEKKLFRGNELYKKTLGLIGLGRIGSLVAERANAFEMKVLVYDPYIDEETAQKNNAILTELDDLIKQSDVISLHVPLTDNTRNLIDKNKIRLMKEQGIIINCARGGIVNENDLYDALKNNKIRGAALDVFEKEPLKNSSLTELDNIILTPHLGANTYEAQDRAGMLLAEQIINAFEKNEFKNIVNR